MASLTRVFAKLFGGTADPNVTGEIGQFGSAKAGTKLNTADIATIQALSAYDKGWSAAVVTSRNYPPIEEVTGVLKTLSYQICYMLQEGVAEYNAETEYKTGSFCKSNNQIYVSLVNSNVGNAVSDTTKWQPVFLPLTGGTLTGALFLPALSSTDISQRAATTSFVRGWAYGETVGKSTIIISSPTSVNWNGQGQRDIAYNLGQTGYLPSDYNNYAYEVLVTIEGKTGTYVGDYMNISIYSDLVGALDSAKAKCVVSDKADLCSWSGWIPIINGRIWLVRSTDWTGSIEKFAVRAFRRLNYYNAIS